MKTKFLRVSVIILIFSSMLIFTACGRGGNSTGTQGSSGDGNENVSNIKLSFNLGLDSSQGEASQLFKKRVEELTEGKLTVEIYPNQQLGDMREQIEQVQSGAIQMTLQGTSTLSNFAKALEFLELPFLFPNDEVMWKVLSGEVGQEVFSELEEANMVGLSYFTQGFRQMTNNQGPIHSPEDVKGQKVRTMPSDLLLETWNNWGANATVIDLGELYNALQQGVVDAEDNSIETITKMSIYEVQEYLTISNHNFLPFAFVGNKDWFNSLPTEMQEAVRTAALEAGEFGIEYIRNTEKEAMEKLKVEMKINELTPEEIEVFKNESKSVYEKYSQDPKSKEIIEKLQKAVEDNK
ncbi:TRAP transporter substrate-binding protein [Fredinandcohnia onubensis]|uniref:TRAP transporter substrate-binding protein n=1 Tax=Fredinandcohnia onubensis TaxID=1571209 RepID=UPI000C0BD04C|nr:TRAP transporter substrate-binding protein [Fredinandcohnia onubensis]